MACKFGSPTKQYVCGEKAATEQRMYSYCIGGAISVVKHNGSRQFANLVEELALLIITRSSELTREYLDKEQKLKIEVECPVHKILESGDF